MTEVRAGGKQSNLPNEKETIMRLIRSLPSAAGPVTKSSWTQLTRSS